MSTVVHTRTYPEPLRCLFRRQITLRFCHDFISIRTPSALIWNKQRYDVPGQKLAHCRAPQQRGLEMDVEMCYIIRVLHQCPVDTPGRARSLVDAHGVGKRAGEEIVVSDRNLRYNLCESPGLFWGKMGQGGYMSLVW